MSEINVPLLRKALEWAEAEDAKGEESQWFQGDWVQSYFAEDSSLSCGTRYCQAGFVGQLLEEGFSTKAWMHVKSIKHREFIDEDSTTHEGMVHVSSYARMALGLDEFKANEYFDAHNTIADLKKLFEAFTGEKY